MAESVIYYCGHMFASDDADEARLARQIGHELDEHQVRAGYGSLACGSDILFAEELLNHGGELHVVLPFAASEFVGTSVEIGGEAWVDRFHHCLGAASSTRIASPRTWLSDVPQYVYGSRYAMGLAKARAAADGHALHQFAVWDGRETGHAAGTSVNVREWAALGGATVCIEPGFLRRVGGLAPFEPAQSPQRSLQVMIFADFPGFAALPEAAIPQFCDEVLGALASLIRRYEVHIRHQNSWGDAVYLVMDRVTEAAELLQELNRLEMASSPLAAGFSAQMRIAAHFGPVFPRVDEITGVTNYFGSEVLRAARVEPVTPPGCVYVTEQFAAQLAVEAPESARVSPVGTSEMAKGFGSTPLYRLEPL